MDDLHKYDSESIRQAFCNEGLSLLTNGSQDDKIKIKDIPGIEVGNWQDWAPIKGVEQPSNEEEVILASAKPLVSQIDTVMSNRTLHEVEDQARDQDEDDEVDPEAEDEYI
jgi:hypothetical protein